MSEVERKLSAAGVYKGASGLEGLLNAQDFWDQKSYGTRLYYGPGATDYLHRGVLSAAVQILSKPVDPLTSTAPDLLALARQYASECAECGGTGERIVNDDGGDPIDDRAVPCPECADIRKVIQKATGLE